MTLNLLSASAIIFALGLSAQMLANFMRIPAIMTLLPLGLIVGPVLGWLNPEQVFGEQLLPFVSFAVAIILFEGGLTLHFRDLKVVGKTVRNLVTIGTVVAWSGGTYLAHTILGLDWGISFLIGAILIVTGPTVIGPLLRQTRLNRKLSGALKWEGILNDPVGAILAVLVYEAIISPETAAVAIALSVFKALLIGGGIGVCAAYILVSMFRFRFFPEYLYSFATLTMVICSFAVSNYIQHEAGLLTVTLMGIFLANQKKVDVNHVTDFKEHLTVVLVSALFIILAADIDIDTLLGTSYKTVLFVAALIFVLRPLTVLACSIGSEMNWRELTFVGFMAPRGIVAAAVSSIFALKLEKSGAAGATAISGVVFSVVFFTVVAYGLSSKVLTRLLSLGDGNPKGVLIVGAHKLAREIALALKNLDIPVVLVDANRKYFLKAKSQGIDCVWGNILKDEIIPEEKLMQIGNLISMTANDGVNALAVLKFSEEFEKSNLFQLPPSDEGSQTTELPMHLRGRYAFTKEKDFDDLVEFSKSGAIVKSTPITEEYRFADAINQVGRAIIPLFFLTEKGDLRVFSPLEEDEPGPGATLISLQQEPELK